MSEHSAAPAVFDSLSTAFAASLADAGVGLYAYDAATRSFQLDATCRRIFDLDADEELSAEVMVARIHPADVDRYWAAAAEGMARGQFACEYRVVQRDGSLRSVLSRARAEPGPEGLLLRGVLIDVTDSRHLEEELAAAEQRMQDLADGVPGLFAYVDRDFVVRFLSRSYDAWYGHSRMRYLHRPLAEVLGEATFLNRKPHYERCLAGETVHYEETRRMANGEERFYSVTYHPARNPAGEVRGILSLAIDITERRRAEEALEARSRELQRSNQDLEQFAYVASHDLKAPLRAIEVLVDWLREDLASYQEGEVQENLGLLKQRTDRLHRLLDDLLAYSRAGRKPGEVADTDTRLLVQDLITLLSPPPGIRVEADPSLPVIRAHHAPLEQVLRNLINNAVKHHPGPEGRVRVYAQEQEDAVLFAVEDDGTGIPEQFAEKVFQMFQTLRPRDEVEGSGMGLAIVKRIVEWQGGRIWFHPGPGGRGTVFKFTWRRQPAADGRNATRSVSGTTGAPVGAFEEHHHEQPGESRAYLAG
jgi:PAS domain S-box-containing protein